MDVGIAGRGSESCVKAMNDEEQALLRRLAHAESSESSDALIPLDARADAEGAAALEDERLLVWLGDTPYLARLPDLREVLFSAPPYIALPFSPAWLWGVFPLRTDLVALADPMPMLMHGPDSADAPTPVAPVSVSAPQAIVVGEGERLIALLVQRIGDIRALQPDELAPLDPATLPADAPLPRYLLGGVTTLDLGRPTYALDVARLADDMLSALEERPAHD